MLFNSGTFLQFFAAFLLLYYLVRHHLAARNILIVLASYFFYGWWDYRFLSLLLISSLLDFVVGLALQDSAHPGRRKLLVTFSVGVSLTILGFFKYYDFFVESFVALAARLGWSPEVRTLQVILPLGISFYTFQTMSYVIDVYRGEMKATRNLVHFLAYVSFFPQLVAGPIERAKHLLPQFVETRMITAAMIQEGLWLCLWGLFKKIVLADNLAPLVELVYEHPAPGGPMVALATFAFGLQIYCDFSGYSDLARGTARLLGFDIMFNFHLPYTALNLREFWRRWHISFSTWLRDYLYISLGGNRRGEIRTYLNLFTTMLLGGLWHGAAWNFVAWGAWHGCGLTLQRLWTRHRRRPHSTAGQPAPDNGNVDRPPRQRPVTPAPALMAENAGPAQFDLPCEMRTERLPQNAGLSAIPSGPAASMAFCDRGVPDPPFSLPRLSHMARAARLGSWCLTMAFVLYGWLLFRAGSWDHAVALTGALGDSGVPAWAPHYAFRLFLFALPLLCMHVWQDRANDLLVPLRLRPWARALLQGSLLIAIVIFWEKEKVPFIYFQF